MDHELQARQLLEASMAENRLRARYCWRRLLGDSEEGLENVLKGMTDMANRSPGSGALHLAAVLGDFVTCQLLIQERCHDVNAEICGATPLTFAANGKNPLPIVKLLLEHGADPNKKCGSNITPLHVTSENDYYDTAHLLLQHGAAIDSISGDGETPCRVAVRTGNTRMLMLLLDNNTKGSAAVNAGAPMTPLILASESGMDECIQVLLNAGADANICDRNGKFPIQLAALGGFTRCVEKLFPYTTPLPDYSNWSVNEIIQQDGFFDAEDEFEQAEIQPQVPVRDAPTRSGTANLSGNISAGMPPRTDPRQNTTGNRQDQTAGASTDSEKREKRIKGNVNFYFAHMDKLPSLLLAVSLAGIAAAQGNIIKVHYFLLQFLCAGTAVAVAGSISAFSHAAFYKETESTHEAGYKFCSVIILVGTLYLLVAISVLVIGFEKAKSKYVIPASVATAALIILTWRLPNDESQTIFTWIFTWIKTKCKKRTEEALPVTQTQS